MAAKGPRAAAKAAGLKTYFTGNPCPKGHVAERITHNSACVLCQVEFLKRQGTPEKRKARAERLLRRREAAATRALLVRAA